MGEILLLFWIFFTCVLVCLFISQDLVAATIIILFVLRRSYRLVKVTLHQEQPSSGSRWASVVPTIMKYIAGAAFLMLVLKYFGSQPVDLNQGYFHEWAKFIPTF